MLALRSAHYKAQKEHQLSNTGCSIPSHWKFAEGDAALTIKKKKKNRKWRGWGGKGRGQGKEKKPLLFPPKIMQQQVHRVSARWPACHTHNCFPSGVWSTQSLAVCQRRTTHKLAYFWWHGPSRHRWSPVSVWLRRTWHSFVNCRRLIYPAMRPAQHSSRFAFAAQPQPRRRGQSCRTPSGHKQSLASVRSGWTRTLSARTPLSFEMSASQLIPTYTWKHISSRPGYKLIPSPNSVFPPDVPAWLVLFGQFLQRLLRYKVLLLMSSLTFLLSALLVCPID